MLTTTPVLTLLLPDNLLNSMTQLHVDQARLLECRCWTTGPTSGGIACQRPSAFCAPTRIARPSEIVCARCNLTFAVSCTNNVNDSAAAAAAALVYCMERLDVPLQSADTLPFGVTL